MADNSESPIETLAAAVVEGIKAELSDITRLLTMALHEIKTLEEKVDALTTMSHTVGPTARTARAGAATIKAVAAAASADASKMPNITNIVQFFRYMCKENQLNMRELYCDPYKAEAEKMVATLSQKFDNIDEYYSSLAFAVYNKVKLPKEHMESIRAAFDLWKESNVKKSAGNQLQSD